MNEQTNDNTPTKRDRTALGWFGLGILIGAVATIGLTTLTRPNTPGVSGVPDLAAIREAAKQGVQEALQEAPLVNTQGVTLAIGLEDVRAAARQGVQEALENNAEAQNDEIEPAPVDASGITARERNTQGESGATVTIIEYSDYQCPYCVRFHEQVYPQIIEQYVKTGKVKFSFKHFPFLSNESRLAAVAAECAANQGHFWEYHKVLFTERSTAGQLPAEKSRLIELASTLKLDQAAFSACVNEDQTTSQVEADAAEGTRLGVRGTPSFLINDKLLVGAQPIGAFQKAIDEALKE
jgi:protein-disulfide isomerase